MPAYRLLLVDDNRLFLRIATRFLQTCADFEPIDSAANAVEAMEKAASLRPDVVLLDINMPITSGLDLIPSLRQLLPGVKIIMLTLWDTDTYRQAAEEAGADAYVPKSTIHAELLPAIMRLVNPRATVAA
jgi:DNA-binding NarL/FixJ family response regulator